MTPHHSLPGPDTRARSAFVAYCPLCSFADIPDMDDILHFPRIRTVEPTRTHPQRHSLHPCCQLTQDAPWCADRSELVRWWNERRQQPCADVATDSRRRNTLAKLKALELEPITTHEPTHPI